MVHLIEYAPCAITCTFNFCTFTKTGWMLIQDGHLFKTRCLLNFHKQKRTLSTQASYQVFMSNCEVGRGEGAYSRLDNC